MPSPTCKNGDFDFSSLDGITKNTRYLGDASKANWVAEGGVMPHGDSILLTMPPDSSGTLLSSTHYVWYGKISATMKSSRGAGVVTAFILMSDVKDEIDWEFIGTDVQKAQSNYYWQGTLNYTNMNNISATNTDMQEHTYTIDWKEDSLTWAIDGKDQRTLMKDETFNSTTNSYQFPQTPSRIQLSLWPAGDPKNGKGTVDWAGGEIDWNSPFMTNGYYKAEVLDVSVECYDAPSGIKKNGGNSYIYNNEAGLQNNVAITGEKTMLSSFFATGKDPGLDPEKKDDKPNVQTVPGVSGGGARGGDGSTSSGGNAGDSGSSDGGSLGGGTGGQFYQGIGSDGSGGGTTISGAGGKTERLTDSSMLAGLIALVALIAF